MIVWTLVLGIIFVSEVLTRLMMPKFEWDIARSHGHKLWHLFGLQVKPW